MIKETEMLFSCLRREEVGIKVARLEQYSSVDWELIVKEAKRHEVGTLLYHTINNLNIKLNIPGDTWEEMCRKYFVSAARNMRLYRELQKIFDLFLARAIPVIALKGAHLAEQVYGNIALRDMGDVDLLVREDDLKIIDVCFLETGGETEQCNRVIAEHNYQFAYRLFASKLRVELHWKLISSDFSCQIDLDGLWQRAQKLQLAQREVLVLSPEDLLIYTCAHAAKHIDVFSVKMLCDITKILGFYENELDWLIIGSRSEQWSVLRAVYAMLRLSQELMGAMIAEEQLSALRPEQFTEDKYYYIRKQTLTSLSSSSRRSVSRDVAKLFCHKSVKSKFVYLIKGLLLSPEAMALKYPAPADSWRIYLYYPVRVKDIFVRYSKELCRLARGKAKSITVTKQASEVIALQKWLLSAD